MKKRLIKIAIILTLFIIISFLLIFIFNEYKERKEKEDSKKIVEKFLKSVEVNKEIETPQETKEEIKKENKVYYHNYLVIGTIEIPAINISFPITEDINENSMKNSLVLLYGEKLNDTKNTVLAGHAYLILDINKLKTDDEIIITDQTGKKITYYVYKNFLADKNDASFYKRETNNKREITLSTCTEHDKNQRHIIFAKEK